MSYGGEIASAFVRIRPNLTGFKTEATTGVKSALTGMQQEVAAIARANIAATQQEIAANRELAASYLAIGQAAKRGSEEAIIATKLAAEQSAAAAARLGQRAAVGGAGGLGGVLGGLGAATAIKGGLAIAGITGAVVALHAALKEVVVGGAQFETSLNVFQAVSEATDAQLKEVSKTAKQLGADITLPNVSAGDAASAMTELAKGGISVKDSMEGARGTLQLAAAGMLDTSQAAGIVAQQLNVFGLSGDKAGHVADLLAGAANSAQGEVSDMAIALQQSAAVARQAGVGIEDTVTAIALLAKNGLIGSDAGTSLRTTFLRLVPSSKQARDQIAALGISLNDTKGNLLPLSQIFQNYQDVLKKLTPVQRQQALTTIFGTDSIRAASILAREGAQGFESLRGQVDKQGNAAAFAAARTKGLAGSFGALKSNLETVAITISQRVNPSIKDFVDSLNDGVTWVQTNWPKIQETIEPTLDNIKEAVRSFADIVSTIWSHWGGEITAVVKTAFGGIFTLTQTFFSNLAALMSTISSILHGDWSAAWKSLEQIPRDSLHAILDFATAWGGTIEAVFTGIWDSIHRQLLVGIRDALDLVGKVPTEFGKGPFKVGFKNPASGAADFFQEQIDALDTGRAQDKLTKAAAASIRSLAGSAEDARGIARQGADSVATEVVAAAPKVYEAGNTAGKALGAGLDTGITTSSKRAIESLQRQLKTAVTESAKTVRAAVLDAQRNLVTLGSGLSTDIAEAIDKGPLGQLLKRLQEKFDFRASKEQSKTLRDAIVQTQKELNIARGQIVTSGPVTKSDQAAIDLFLKPKTDAARDARRAFRDFSDQSVIGGITTRIQKEKDDTAKAVSALTTAFVSSGKITAEQFAAKVSTILGEKSIAFTNAGKNAGSAFATGFRDETNAIIGQAGIIEKARGKTPALLGEGGKPELVKPLTVLSAQLKTLQDIRRELRETKADAKAAAAKAAAKPKPKKNQSIVQLSGGQGARAAALNRTTG